MAYKINLVSSHCGSGAIVANCWYSEFGGCDGKDHTFQWNDLRWQKSVCISRSASQKAPTGNKPLSVLFWRWQAFTTHIDCCKQKSILVVRQLLYVWICTEKNILIPAKLLVRRFPKLHFWDSQLTGNEYLKAINSPSPLLQFMPTRDLPAKRYLASKAIKCKQKASFENRYLCFSFKKTPKLMLQIQVREAWSLLFQEFLHCK